MVIKLKLEKYHSSKKCNLKRMFWCTNFFSSIFYVNVMLINLPVLLSLIRVPITSAFSSKLTKNILVRTSNNYVPRSYPTTSSESEIFARHQRTNFHLAIDPNINNSINPTKTQIEIEKDAEHQVMNEAERNAEISVENRTRQYYSNPAFSVEGKEIHSTSSSSYLFKSSYMELDVSHNKVGIENELQGDMTINLEHNDDFLVQDHSNNAYISFSSNEVDVTPYEQHVQMTSEIPGEVTSDAKPDDINFTVPMDMDTPNEIQSVEDEIKTTMNVHDEKHFPPDTAITAFSSSTIISDDLIHDKALPMSVETPKRDIQSTFYDSKNTINSRSTSTLFASSTMKVDSFDIQMDLLNNNGDSKSSNVNNVSVGEFYSIDAKIGTGSASKKESNVEPRGTQSFAGDQISTEEKDWDTSNKSDLYVSMVGNNDTIEDFIPNFDSVAFKESSIPIPSSVSYMTRNADVNIDIIKETIQTKQEHKQFSPLPKANTLDGNYLNALTSSSVTNSISGKGQSGYLDNLKSKSTKPIQSVRLKGYLDGLQSSTPLQEKERDKSKICIVDVVAKDTSGMNSGKNNNGISTLFGYRNGSDECFASHGDEYSAHGEDSMTNKDMPSVRNSDEMWAFEKRMMDEQRKISYQISQLIIEQKKIAEQIANEKEKLGYEQIKAMSATVTAQAEAEAATIIAVSVFDVYSCEVFVVV